MFIKYPRYENLTRHLRNAIGFFVNKRPNQTRRHRRGSGSDYGKQSLSRIYISRYKNVAVKEMHRMGIPASITLAQAILESDGGRSELARQANNHFGIKCGANWGGKTYLKMDDNKTTDSIPVMSCFRKYDKEEESFQDHSMKRATMLEIA